MNTTTPNLKEIMTFIEVGRCMSLSEAARTLRVSTATVSRRLDRLEGRLGVKLLDRSTRGISLTEVGASYVEVAERGLDLILEAEERVQDILKKPAGMLRVAAPSVLVRHQLGDIAIEYARLYPDVELHLLEVDQEIDLDEEDIHVAIQVLPPSKWELQGMRASRTLTRKSLGKIPILICASPEYLERHGPIDHPDDLKRHRCIVQGANPSARFIRLRDADGEYLEVEVSMGIFTDSIAFCKKAALEGIGVAGLTLADCGHLLKRGNLVRVLEDWELEPVRCVIAFVEGPRPPRRIRVFLDLVDEHFKLTEFT